MRAEVDEMRGRPSLEGNKKRHLRDRRPRQPKGSRTAAETYYFREREYILVFHKLNVSFCAVVFFRHRSCARRTGTEAALVDSLGHQGAGYSLGTFLA